jgi:hypothetical protein
MAAGGGCRGGAVSGEVGALVDYKRPWEAPRVLGSVLGARVVKGTAGRGGDPAATAIARRAGAAARG